MVRAVPLRAAAVAIAVALTIPLPVQAARAPTVSLTVSADGPSVVIRANAIVAGDLATAWKVLTDYGNYARFVPGLETSRVVARDGAQVTVEQNGVAPLWLLHLPLDITYRITEYPPSRIVSRASLAGHDTLDSEYQLTPRPEGVELEYEGHLTVRSGTLTLLREKAGEKAIAEHFRALADEMERTALGIDHPANETTQAPLDVSGAKRQREPPSRKSPGDARW